MKDEFSNIIELLPHFCTVFFEGKNDKYKLKTKIAYALDIKVFLYFLMTELPEQFSYESMEKIELDKLDLLTLDDFTHYMRWLENYEMDGKNYKNSAAGKKRKLATIRALYHYFTGRGMLKNNPTIYIETPVIKEKEIVVLTENEKERMKDLIDSGSRKENKAKSYHEKTKLRDYAIYLLFLGTGIRVSELAGINDLDVDYEEQSVLVTRKGGKIEKVYFGHEVLLALLDYIETERYELLGISEEERREMDGLLPDGPLFVSLQRKRISVRRVQMIIKEYGTYAAASKKKITPHVLRKSFGSELYAETGDILLVQKVLGHASPQTTQKFYTKFDNARKEIIKGRSVLKSNTKNNK